MASVWEIIEATPEAAAALSWRRWLGPAFDAVAAVCLRETRRMVERIPCDFGCACNHRVRRRDTGLVGVCDCGEECQDVPLTEADVKVWEVDLARLGRAVAKGLKGEARDTKLGLERTQQIAALGDEALPIVLTLPHDERDFTNTVAQLVARLPKGFVLLSPTKRFCTAPATELLGKVNAGFFSLEAHVTLLASGKLHAAKSGAELFAAHLPEKKEAILESDSVRVFRLFRELLAMGTKLTATPAQVFDFMVFKKMTRAETALACKCSAPLITRRVALIEGHFHMPIEKLLAFASDLKERDSTVKGDRYAKKKRGAIPDEPRQYNDDDDNSPPPEEYRYEKPSQDD